MKSDNSVRYASSRIWPIDTVKAIAAFLVLLNHSGVEWAVPSGIACMVFLVMSSGLLMAMHHEHEVVARCWPWWPSLWRRAVPFYLHSWLALAMMLVFVLGWNVQSRYINWHALPFDVLLLQSWVPNRNYFFSFNSVTWFLCSLLFCYLCFPALCRIFARWRLRTQLLVVAGVWLVWLAVLWNIQNPEIHVWCHVLPPVRLLEFALGIVLWHVVQRLRAWWKRHRRLALAAEWAALALLCLVMWLQRTDTIIDIRLYDSVPYVIPVALALLVIMLNAGHEGHLGQLLSCRPLRWLGKMYMELFIYQVIGSLLYAYVIAPLIYHFTGALVYEAYIVVQLFLMVLIAWPVHRWISPRFDMKK